MVIIQGREGDAEVVEKACVLAADAVEKRGENRTLEWISEWKLLVREHKAVFGVEQGAGLAVHPFAHVEKRQTETGGIQLGGRRDLIWAIPKAGGDFYSDGMREHEELPIDFIPDLARETEEI